MKVGDLVMRRSNGDLALILRIFKESEVPSALSCKKGFMEVQRVECGNIQHVWDWEYEVVSCK